MLSNESALKGQLLEASSEKILGNYDKAVLIYEKILNKNPEVGVAHFELSEIYTQKKDAENAINHAKKALEIDPNNEWYKYNLARIYQETRMLKESIKLYKELSNEQPKNLEYLYSLAECQLQYQDIEGAAKTYDLVENNIGISSELSIYKKNLYLSINQPDKAINEMVKLCNNFPNEPQHLMTLAKLYKDYDRTEEYNSTLDKITQINPNDGNIHFLKAKIFLENKEYDKATIHLESAFASESVFTEEKVECLDQYFSLIYLNPEQTKIALNIAQKALNIDLTNTQLLSRTAEYATKLGETDLAVKIYDKLVKNEPSNIQSWYNYSNILISTDQYEKLDSVCQEAVETFPNQPEFYNFWGVAKLNLEKYDDALFTLQLGKDLCLNNISLKQEILMNIARVYFKQKKYAEGIKNMDLALEFTPGKAYILNNYAYELALANTELDKALEMTNQALKTNPTDANFIDTKAWVLFRKKEYSEAKDLLTPIVSQTTGLQALYFEHYGDILYMLNDKENAIKYWEKAKFLGLKSKNLESKIALKKYVE